jgi:hypothetical protein
MLGSVRRFEPAALLPLLLPLLFVAGCTVPTASADPEPRTAVAVIDAGTLPTVVRLKKVHPRLQLKLPHEKRLECRRDSDCAFWTRPCSCPPCGEVWREVVNREELARLKSAWARRRCVQPKCEPCQGRYLGTKPICDSRQCAAK